MKRILITGITGFAGSHLAEFLINKNYEIYGIARWRSKLDNIIGIKDKIKLIEADIRDSHSVEKALSESMPDYIFHLAAQSFVPMSWRAPADTMETNAIGTIHVLEAARHLKSHPVIHVAGTSEEYGFTLPDESPIKETNQLRPLSTYGVSKVAADKLACQYYKSYQLKTVVSRGFNHTGPRRGDVFATSTFALQIAQIEKGLKEPIIHVGNLEAKRDFTDVRDMVRAYWLAATMCDYGEVYNICSEKSITIQSVLDLLLSMSKIKIEIKQDPARMRPSDVLVLQGDCSKFRAKTRWKPEINFERTMEDLLNYWRQRI
jgi:GDP-4-dehydro-6-deoxy-D-mannose reductase